MCSVNGYFVLMFIIKRGNEIVNSIGGRFVICNIQFKEEDVIYICELRNMIGIGVKRELKIIV